jgi:hypothetical protein
MTTDDGQRNCPKYVEFHSKISLRNNASSWFCYKEITTAFFKSVSVITPYIRDATLYGSENAHVLSEGFPKFELSQLRP